MKIEPARYQGELHVSPVKKDPCPTLSRGGQRSRNALWSSGGTSAGGPHAGMLAAANPA